MRILASLLAVLLLAGCAGRPAATPAPSPSPEPPPSQAEPATLAAPATPQPPPPPAAVVDPCGGLLRLWNGGPAPGACQFRVSTEQVHLQVSVTAGSAEEAERAVSVASAGMLWPAGARWRVDPKDSWDVSITLGEGKAGDAVAVTITPAPGKPPVTATLIRAEPPQAAILLQGEDGAWAPIQAGVSLPPGPKRLRIQTNGGIKVTSLKPQYVTSNFAQLTPDRITRVADDLLEVEFTNPPPLVQVYVGGQEGPNGLRMPTVSGHFYIGEAPQFVALDRATGKVERIGPAPPDLAYLPVLRQDGRYLAMTTLQPESVSGHQVWLFDLKSGRLTRTPFAYEDGEGPGFDIRGRLIAPAGPGRIGMLEPESGKVEIIRGGATFWTDLSPDRRYIAGRIGPPPNRSTGAWVGHPRAYGLVVRDLSTDSEKLFPWTGYGKLMWLPDGRLLQVTVASDEYPGPNPPPERQERSFTVDLATGAQTPYTAPWPRPAAQIIEGNWAPGDRPLAILPDGRVLIYRWANAPHARMWML